MRALMISFVSGLLFAVGLVVSGMTNPQKVLGFLDVFGAWDPTLAFVMGGAVLINAISFRFVLQNKPLCADSHDMPSKTSVDTKLILGAVLFGIGWGLLGICPGPGIVNFTTLHSNAIIFVVAMWAGMMVYRGVDQICSK